MTTVSIRGVTIFYCYASADERHLLELEKQLGVLRRTGKVSTWYDRHIKPGMDWEHEIESHLNAADIILLLISPDFIESDYCYNVEMKRALERHFGPEETPVIPIILRPVNWHGMPIGKLQAWPDRGKPIVKWESRDLGYQNAAKGITMVVNRLLAQQWRNEGKTYYMHGHYDEALQAYEEALRLDANAELHRDKWHVLLKLQRYNEALETYNTAIELAPENAFLYIYKGDAFFKLKRYPEALVVYEQSARINPDHPYVYIHKGRAFLEAGQAKEALASFEKALQINPQIDTISADIERAREALKQAV